MRSASRSPRWSLGWSLLWEDDVAPEQHAALGALLARCFPRSRTPFGPGRSWSDGRPELRVVARDGDRPVAHVAVLRRFVQIGGAAQLVGDVGLVAVEPAEQGRGLGAELLARCAATLDELELPYGFLTCGEHVVPFYARGGWVRVPGPTRTARADGTVQVYGGASMVLQIAATAAAARLPLLTANAADFVVWTAWSTWSRCGRTPDDAAIHGRRAATRAWIGSGMLSAVATWGNLLRRAAEAGLELLTQQTRSTERPAARPRPPSRSTPTASRSRARTAPTGDRARRIAYAPDLDGAADPGEVVWAWVPYEEGDGRGKDRPVLVVGRQDRELVGLMLSSQADRAGDRDWLGVGAGAWDAQGRPSYVRLDRVIEVGEHEIRREGAVLDEARFDRVADALRSRYGWS